MASLTSILYNIVVGWITLFIFFYMLGFLLPKATFVGRALASYFALVVSSLFGVTAAIVLRLVGYGQLSQWVVARFFKYAMLVTTGVNFVAEDPNGYLEKVRPAVFVANHQTELDVCMLGSIFPKWCSMTAKSSLRHTPFLGWFMTLSGTIFLNRSNTAEARKKMSGAANEIRNKRQSVYIFPEGTRSYTKDPVLLPFKKGAFHLAVQAQVPIVPIVVANYSHILWIKGLIFRSGTIPVKVLDPIPTTGMTAEDVDKLTQTTRELMLKELVELTARARGEANATPVSRPTNGEVVKVTGVEKRVAA
ncbi:putative 1-acylglycerol-3-phosphate protein [Thermochaetoides thermophila DSM 1495]|uniref:1-acyl-sn-glycerol-3-phosphate acyltransferase n=1 Tax=Chaetomium thermophilum (strain DSM 1495 / CBS 144.50 / IMI 039719) TaxID=759272 RepID=G0SHJ0_CHATD|nr:putative 1-acylglycerol-3-phosphate protein [Thermochaetoides thermophila DSM 1495]EGS17679.1 putative 1-acylglycerol-3-phosphate protein [Thermochaetoides thermophila DSM 1495]